MDIHKPKPVHSFREFLNEIAVIITGVLIALGLEQTVEQWHWHNEVIEARETLREEVADNLSALQHSVTNSTCALANIELFKKLVQEKNIAAVKASVAKDPFTKLGLWQLTQSNTAWQTVNAGGLLAHMESRERLIFAQTYNTIEVERGLRTTNWATITDLAVKATDYDGSPEMTRALLNDASSVALFYRSRVILQYPRILESAATQLAVRPLKLSSADIAITACHPLSENDHPS